MIEAALRAWRSDPSDEALRRLEDACERASQPLPWDALLATPRWRWLRDHALPLCTEPPSPSDGESWEAIGAAEAASGLVFPRALKEWYALVGRRLSMVQDCPVSLTRLARLAAETGRLTVYIENQGCWEAQLTGDGADPAVEVGDEGSETPPWVVPQLSEFLFGMVICETLIAAQHGLDAGPLGPLRPELARGHDITDEPERLDALPLLASEPWRLGEWRSSALRGDRELLVEVEGGRVTWIASPEGERRLAQLMTLQASETWTLELRFAGDELLIASIQYDGLLDLIRAALREGSHNGVTELSGDEVVLSITTTAPEEDAARVRAALREDHSEPLAILMARARPGNRGRWREL